MLFHVQNEWSGPSSLSLLRRELSETILDSGDTLLTILGDILDFSKIDHNSMVLESAPVRLPSPPLPHAGGALRQSKGCCYARFCSWAPDSPGKLSPTAQHIPFCEASGLCPQWAWLHGSQWQVDSTVYKHTSRERPCA